jgi:3-hydroxy-9,10-secoandrosta-1,3,5(10)-triene-9,17-dione monooxygenase reductase component
LPIEPDNFRQAMSAIPTGVTVVTAMGDEGPSGMTANAVVSLSAEPPMMLACLDRGARTLASVRGSGRFLINVLASTQAELAPRFASKDPEPEKWVGVPWAVDDGVPRIAGGVAWIRCELHDLIDGGDHLIVTGSVEHVETSDRGPLIFHRGRYLSLG